MTIELADLLGHLLSEIEIAAAKVALLGSPGAGADSGSRPGGCPLSIAAASVDLPVYLALPPAKAAVLAALPGRSALFERTAALGRLRVSFVCTAEPRK